MNLLRTRFDPALVIFDKDGTLIDFNFMWGTWVTELAGRLGRAVGVSVANELYAAIGFDMARKAVIAGSPLAAHSMAELRVLTAKVLDSVGLTKTDAERAVNEAWFVPDPVASARPLADLVQVLSIVKAQNVLIAVATSDDRASTLETLYVLGIAQLVNALVSADDGLKNKPAPDMLLHICRELNVSPAASVIVGDSTADMEAARAAGIGLRVGVLSGVSSREQLLAHADVIIDSIQDL